jgi:flagellin
VVLNLGDATALRNLAVNSDALRTDATRLATGLRINTAADDPSGLAIAEKLRGAATGFDQGSANVQSANNALNVADGALATISDILQRIRSLAVEASSDLTSENDRENLQAETAQLLLEVNRISQNASFNGTSLLDGSHSGFVAAVPASLTVMSNSALISSSGGTPTGSLLLNGDLAQPVLPANSFSSIAPAGWTVGGPALSLHQLNNGISSGTASNPPPSGSQYESLRRNGTLSQTVGNLQAGTYSLNFDYSDANNIFGNIGNLSILVDGVVVQNLTGPPPVSAPYVFESILFSVPTTGAHTIEFLGPSAGVGAANIANISLTTVSLAPTSAAVGISNNLLIASAVAANANFQTTVGGTAGLGGIGTTDGTIEVQVINTGASIAVLETFLDSASGFASVSPVLYAPGQTASTLDNVAVTLGNFGAQDVGTTAFVKIYQETAAHENGPALNVHSGAAEGAVLAISLDAVNTSTLRISNINLSLGFLASEDAIGQVDGALSSLERRRAEIGAQTVALQDDAQNDNIASVNLTASVSQIADADIGATTADFVRRQVMQQLGTGVLGQIQIAAQDVLSLFA